MKNKQLFHELASWQWEISGYQKAAFLIEERLDVIHKSKKNAKPVSSVKVEELQKRFIEEERKLDELEKEVVCQKEILRQNFNSTEWENRIETEQQKIRNKVKQEKSVFALLKNDYHKVLTDMLLKIAS